MVVSNPRRCSALDISLDGSRSGRSIPIFGAENRLGQEYYLLWYYGIQNQTITSVETGFFATTSGGSTITLPTTMTFVLTVTGTTNQSQASNNASTGTQSGSGALNIYYTGITRSARGLIAGYISP